MIGRALAIAKAALVEALRARLSPLVALVLVFAVPLIVGFSGQDEATKAWLTRAATVEGLRTVMPLAVIIGAGFMLKPAMKRGWTVLPAARSEYFAGIALAGALVLGLCAGLFALGGYMAGIAYGERLSVTAPALSVTRQRLQDGRMQTAPGREGGLTWADPRFGEELVFELPDTGKELRGSIEFLLVLNLQAPPRERQPVALWIEGPSGRAPLITTVESRNRMSFEGEVEAGSRLVVQPVAPGLVVGSSVERVRLETESANALASMLRLLFVSLCAGLLCVSAVLLVRALSTAPTAVLAGLLLIATLTMLPGLAGSGTGVSRALSALPQLFPQAGYEEFLAARIVPDAALLDGLWRLLVALALLPIGAALFKLREIAK